MQQRYYDPESGRFLSTDPVLTSSDGGNFNRYWYANDNPYRYTDRDGRCPECIGAAIGALLEIAVQYKNPEDRAAYAAAGSDFAHGHFIAAIRTAGPQALKVLISAGAGAAGAGIAGKIGELADAAAQATNASAAGKVTVGALVEISGNAAAGSGVNTVAQVGKNAASGQPLGQGVGAAARAGAIGGAVGGATKVGFTSSTQRLANDTGVFIGTSNGQVAAPNAIPAGAERAAAAASETATHAAMCKDKSTGGC